MQSISIRHQDLMTRLDILERHLHSNAVEPLLARYQERSAMLERIQEKDKEIFQLMQLMDSSLGTVRYSDQFSLFPPTHTPLHYALFFVPDAHQSSIVDSSRWIPGHVTGAGVCCHRARVW